ncbi:MAG: 6-phosphogluconolactonase [Syntrophotaleaceae bacterium]
MSRIRWQLAGDEEELAARACRHILRAADQAIAARSRFTLVLAGGDTPQRCYRLLSQAEAAWSAWNIYFGDERCRPADDLQRNSAMAGAAWLSQSAIPAPQIHAIPAELGAQAAARAYEPLVRQALPFDLVLLGLGSDGHTASLFPGAELDEQALVHPVIQAPKPPAERVTLSAAALSRSRDILVLVSGRSKRAVLKAWRDGAGLPISTLQPLGSLTVLYDREADPGFGA